TGVQTCALPIYSFMISRPWRELARPAARISPSGELARSSLRRSWLSFLSLIQRQTSPSKCGGVTRAGRRVQKRSTTMAAAVTEQRMIGSMIQPPALTNSHTVAILRKSARHSTTARFARRSLGFSVFSPEASLGAPGLSAFVRSQAHAQGAVGRGVEQVRALAPVAFQHPGMGMAEGIVRAARKDHRLGRHGGDERRGRGETTAMVRRLQPAGAQIPAA